MGEEEGRRTYADVDGNVATNLRYFRERAGLSQDELAQRMAERDFGFTQATIWKIESGQRPVKISEVIALGDALGLLSWTWLASEPRVGRQLGELQVANRRAYVAYAQLKDAARRYLEEQIGVALAVREARDAGLDTEHWVSWLDTPGERAVIEARVEAQREEEVADEHEREVNAAMDKLRRAGYEPLRPEDIVVEGGAS